MLSTYTSYFVQFYLFSTRGFLFREICTLVEKYTYQRVESLKVPPELKSFVCLHFFH